MSGNVVTAFRYARGKSRAECSCGWDGPFRLLTGRAAVDALAHCTQFPHCQPDWPLRLDIPVREWAWAPILIFAAILGGGLYAAPHADATPLTYIQSLKAHGLSVYNPAVALASGYEVCQQLNTATVDVVAANVYATTSYADVPDLNTAATIIVVSVEELCPWHDHRAER